MSRAATLAARIDAVPVRSPEISRAIQGKRPGSAIVLEVDGCYVRLTLSSVVPVRRVCAKCRKPFAPVRSIDICCSEQCKRVVMYMKRCKAVAEGRCRLTDGDSALLAYLGEVGEATNRMISERFGNWVGNSLIRLKGLRMIEKIGPRKGGVYRLVSDRVDSIAQE